MGCVSHRPPTAATGTLNFYENRTAPAAVFVKIRSACCGGRRSMRNTPHATTALGCPRATPRVPASSRASWVLAGQATSRPLSGRSPGRHVAWPARVPRRHSAMRKCMYRYPLRFRAKLELSTLCKSSGTLYTDGSSSGTISWATIRFTFTRARFSHFLS